MTDGTTIRIINDIHYICRDLGCPDFASAAWNREMVKDKLFTIGYQVVEEYLKHSPRKWALPSWIPQGELPMASKKDWQQHGGEQGRMYEIEQ